MIDSKITEKSYTRSVSAENSDNEDITMTEKSNDKQIKAYVDEFKREVEFKFSKSQVNAEYKLHRKKRM